MIIISGPRPGHSLVLDNEYELVWTMSAGCHTNSRI